MAKTRSMTTRWQEKQIIDGCMAYPPVKAAGWSPADVTSHFALTPPTSADFPPAQGGRNQRPPLAWLFVAAVMITPSNLSRFPVASRPNMERDSRSISDNWTSSGLWLHRVAWSGVV